MKLINNRFRIEEIKVPRDGKEAYIVEDLWNKGSHKFMRILDCDKHSNLISYFGDNFLEISQIKHKNLLSSHHFGIIETINLKKTNTKLYYLITDKTDFINLDQNVEFLSLNERLNIILDIMSVIDYIHFRGLIYKSLSPFNIFFSKNQGIKLASISASIIMGQDPYYDNFYEDFIAPEIIINEKDINIKADYYSIGMMMKYLLYKDYLNDNSDYFDQLCLTRDEKLFLDDIINNLTNREATNRDIRLRVHKDSIISFFNLDYSYDLSEERNNIFLKTKLIGMKDELQNVFRVDNKIQENSNRLIGTIIKGYGGLGKTRFLTETIHRLKMQGREVHKIDIVENDLMGIYNLSNFLRHITSYASAENINKYKDDFAFILPELKLDSPIREIDLNQINERYRLFNRINNFLIDISKDNIIYIAIDNFEKSNHVFTSLIDYLIKNSKPNKVFFLISYVDRGNDRIRIGNMIEQWHEKGLINKIYLKNLTEDETGLLVKSILGISYIPKNFASIIYRESRGNPSYIDFIIKDLINREELYINKNGNWETKEDDYSDINFPTDFSDTIINQLKKYKPEYLEVIKAMSIFNTILSKRMLLTMVNFDTNTLDNVINTLIEDRIVEEQIVEWGFNYNIINGELKRYVYMELSDAEKQTLHEKASDIILSIYSMRNKALFDELIFHLVRSGDDSLALEIIFKEIDELENKYSINAINLWEKAYSIIKEKNQPEKLRILEKLTEIFSLKGDTEKIKLYLEEFKKVAKEFNSIEHLIRAKFYYSNMYLREHKLDEVEKEIAKLEKMSRENHVPEGIIYSAIMKGRMSFTSGNLESIDAQLSEAQEMSYKYDIKEHLGSIHTIRGILRYLSGNTEEAINEYIQSIKCFEESKNVFEVVKPINNLGTIYTELFGDLETGLNYYEQGLEIASKYGFAQLENTFLNNIGELYLNSLDYNKALEYINSSNKLALETNEYRLLFLSHINLGFISLFTNQLDKAYESYIFLQDANEKNPIYDEEISCQYNNFLGEFYYSFGEMELALKHSVMASNSSKDFNIKEHLRAESRIQFIKYHIDGNLDKREIYSIINKYKETGIVYENLKNILNYCKLCIFNNEIEFAAELYNVYLELKGNYEADCLNYNSHIIELLLSGAPISETEKLLDDISTCTFLRMDIDLHLYIGLRYYNSKDYTKSLRQLLETLDYLYKAVKSIPDGELKYNLIVYKKGDLIKKKINKIYNDFYNKKIETFAYINDINMDYDKYFDFSPLLELLSNEQFDEIINAREDSLDIKTLEELLIKLGDNYKKNLNLILDFICRETLAQKGFIISLDEGQNMEITSSYPNNDNGLPNEKFLLHTIRNRGPILINRNSSDSSRSKYDDYLLEELTGVICVPINIYDNFSTFNLDRRRIDTTHNNKLIGYIYLETNKIFNRFDLERFKLICSISNLIFLNIENHNLELISTTDKLTGVFTRKYFETRFESLLNNYKQTGDSFSLLMIDIDRFKVINDTYGHLKGDEVLSHIGKTIMDNIRTTDIVGRYGGEEFIVILQNTTIENGIEIGEKIRTKIEEIAVKGVELPITVSIGMCQYPHNSQFKEDLINKADQALYYAKEVLSRNRLVLWHEGMDKTYNNVDKVLGVITGNTIIDNRNMLAIVDTAELVVKEKCYRKKIYDFLGRIVDIVDGEYASLILLEDNELIATFSRKRKDIGWVESLKLNSEIINRVIRNKKGEYIIDWYNLITLDKITENPNWQSVIVIPLINNGKVLGVVYISVPLKEKEFSSRSFNIANILSNIFTNNINSIKIKQISTV